MNIYGMQISRSNMIAMAGRALCGPWLLIRSQWCNISWTVISRKELVRISMAIRHFITQHTLAVYVWWNYWSRKDGTYTYVLFEARSRLQKLMHLNDFFTDVLRVCIRVWCMHACAHVCMFTVFARLRLCPAVYVHTSVCMCISRHVHAYLCASVCTHVRLYMCHVYMYL